MQNNDQKIANILETIPFLQIIPLYVLIPFLTILSFFSALTNPSNLFLSSCSACITIESAAISGYTKPKKKQKELMNKELRFHSP
jgi:hypothetical protein